MPSYGRRVKPHTTGRRLRAARTLAGYDNIREFADALNYPRLGEKTLRKIENDGRDLEPHEIIAISVLCDISPEWFSADLSQITEIDPRVEAAFTLSELLPQLEGVVRALSQAPEETDGAPGGPDRPRPEAEGGGA